MVNKKDYGLLVLDSLIKHEIINEELYEKCSKPKYIQNLPGDLRTTDTNILQERKNAITDKIDETKNTTKDLEKDKKFYNNMLDTNGGFLLNRVEEINDNIRNVFEDYFGDPTTDKPQKIIHDAREGLENGNKIAKDMEKFIKQINTFKKDYDSFQKKINTAVNKHENPEVIRDLIKNFQGKFEKFQNNYRKYRDNYGSGGYLEDGSASRSMQLINQFFKANDFPNYERYEHLIGYTNSYMRLDSINIELEAQNEILDNYNIELGKVNNKLN